MVIVNTEMSSECEKLENKLFEYDNTVTRLTITMGGNESDSKS